MIASLIAGPLLFGLALAEPPVARASLAWARGLGWVELAAPAGWHVAPEAPSRLTIGTLEVAAFGDLSGLRFPVREGPVEVALSFAVCENSGTTCVPVALVGTGVVTGKGELALAPRVSVAAGAIPVGTGLRIYDFTAVWCPPCNLMKAEMLDDPSERQHFGAFEVVPVDVDRVDSWPLKDRYAVGGYPTLVAVDAAGNELSRLVGYPGEEPMRAWLGSLLTGQPLHTLIDGPVTGTPAERAAAARRLAEGEYEEAARRWLVGADNGLDAHMARLVLDGRPEDADWLLANAPPGPWVVPVLAARPEAWARALPALVALPPTDAADALSLVADRLEGDAAKAVRAAAIAILRGTMTGDPAHDRAHVTFLAELYRGTGQVDAGLALLDEYALQFPGEFTFDHTAARLLLEERRYAQAEARARIALAKSWGDQRLRAVQPLAKALAAQGRLEEALALLKEELAAAPEPGEGVNVRTTRYRAQVDTLRRELPANYTPAVLAPTR